jgi:hypothetical protein
VAKSHSPLKTRTVRLCEAVVVLFTLQLSREQDNSAPLRNSAQHFRLECNHNRKDIHYWERASLTNNGMGITIQPLSRVASRFYFCGPIHNNLP